MSSSSPDSPDGLQTDDTKSSTNTNTKKNRESTNREVSGGKYRREQSNVSNKSIENSSTKKNKDSVAPKQQQPLYNNNTNSNINSSNNSNKTGANAAGGSGSNKSNSCQQSDEPSTYVNVPTQDRLSARPKTTVDKMRKSLRFPPEAVPRTYLPNWPDLPLTSKLPLLPAPPNAIVFSRGAIAQPLFRRNQTFTLNDPFGKLRTPADEYNALHDAHAYSYFEKPAVRKLLVSQGLINGQNEVLCTQREFNRFRAYLASIQNDTLSGSIESSESRWSREREQFLRLLKYDSMTSSNGRDYARWVKTQNAARKTRMRQEEMCRRMEEKKDAEAARARKFAADRQRKILNRKLLAQERDRLVCERRRKRDEQVNAWRKQLIATISAKDAAVQARVEEEKAILQRAYHQFMMEWLDSKYHFQENQKPKQEAIERAIESNLKKGAADRQARVEEYRHRFPELLEARRERQQYLFSIMKKYFYRWLNKTREKKGRKPDAQHQSLWETVMVMEDTLKYLIKESGYAKLDDFILNVLKLKEEIKIRLAEEEAEELEREQRMKEETERDLDDADEAGAFSGVEGDTENETDLDPEPVSEAESQAVTFLNTDEGGNKGAEESAVSEYSTKT